MKFFFFLNSTSITNKITLNEVTIGIINDKFINRVCFTIITMEDKKEGLDSVLITRDYEMIIDSLELYEAHLNADSEQIVGTTEDCIVNAERIVNLGRLKAIMVYAQTYNGSENK